MRRTYAWFDAIGIREGLKDGSAPRRLQSFWNACNQFANHGADGVGPLQLEGERAATSPAIRVRTLSDSAIMWTQDEHTLPEFYRLVGLLKSRIEKQSGSCYCIVNRDEELRQSGPDSGMVVVGGDFTRAFEQVMGSGPSWINLYLADQHLTKKCRHWHETFSLYAVGDDSIPVGLRPKASSDFEGLDKAKLKLHAIR